MNNKYLLDPLSRICSKLETFPINKIIIIASFSRNINTILSDSFPNLLGPHDYTKFNDTNTLCAKKFSPPLEFYNNQRKKHDTV